MAWNKLVTTTLGSAAASFDMSTVPDNKFIILLGHIIRNSSASYTQPSWRVGNGTIVTGAEYAYRYSRDGSAEETTGAGGGTTISPWWTSPTDPTADVFSVSYLFNLATEEKLIITNAMDNNDAGAATAPRRVEVVGKWADTTNTIDEIRCYDYGGGSGFDTDSNIASIGSDGTEELNVQDGAVYYETDTNKSYVLSSNTWTEL
jgi:hypothetical protein